MPAMQTRLNAVINKVGVYQGFSANYSGAGFSGMRFAFHGVEDDDFDKWVAAAKAGGGALDRTAYLQLERPSENEPVRRYASVDATLFNAILNMCVEPNKMCMSEMSAIDAKGGLGLAAANNILPLEYDKKVRRGAVFGNEPSYVAALCTIEDPAGVEAGTRPVAVLDTARLTGAGLPRPPLTPLRFPPASSSDPARPLVQMFTAHGAIMVFFVAMPFVTGLMNFLVPLQIGARDVSFPFLNNFSFWMTVGGAVLVMISLFVGDFARAGWLAYPPLS